MTGRVLVFVLGLATTGGADPRRVNQPLVPYALEPLQWGDVQPRGWLLDWATAARHGAASPERATFATEKVSAIGQPGCVAAPSHPGPVPGYSCPNKEEHTDQFGGNGSAFQMLWNLTDAECCNACIEDPRCDVWVSGLLNNQPGDPVGCWRLEKPSGKAQHVGRTAGFVRNDPGVECESINGWRGGRPSYVGFWDEDSAYWIDGMTRLGAVLHDDTLMARVKEDIDAVLANPIYFHNTWSDEHDLSAGSAEGWVRSVYSRAMLAYIDATGDFSVQKFLERAFSNYTALDSQSDRSLTQIEALLEGHAYGGPDSMKSTALMMMEVNNISQHYLEALLSGCATNETAIASGGCIQSHGVSFNEIAKLFAMAYSWNGNSSYLQASVNAFEMLELFHVQVHGVNSADEQLNGIGPNFGTETCDVSDFTYSNEWMLRVTGNGLYADRTEKATFNAGAGAVNRTYLAHLYYQSPNLLNTSDGIAWFPSEEECFGQEAHGNCRYTRWTFGHFHLPPCCTGNQARMLPNFIHHMSFGVADSHTHTSGVAVSIYGPNRVNAEVGPQSARVALQLDITTNYPFDEDVRLSMSELESATTFPLMMRVPRWCSDASLKFNGKAITMPNVDSKGFVTLNRLWNAGDQLILTLPMRIRATKRKTFMNGKHAPLSHTSPWTGASVTPGLPFCEVEVGPLAFALPLEKTPSGPANYAIDCNASTMTLTRREMPQLFDWPLDSPISVQVKAQEIEWRDVWVMPSTPFLYNTSAAEVQLTLIPYGSAKAFKISMFPYLQ
eukprot:m.475363 g.475363  ORF g.475363 m.475363 type:complete len:782 (-) comp38181_c0_seq1:62-2407(-)